MARNQRKCILTIHSSTLLHIGRDTATGKPCNVTHRRKSIHNRYNVLLEEFNLNASNIILLENFNQNYVRESAEILKIWLDDSNNIQDGTFILHNEGSGFSELADDENFNSKWFKHITYPLEIHELLSPNDNGWHGPAENNGELNVANVVWTKMMA